MLLLLLTFAVPLVILIVTYGRIAIKLYFHKSPGNADNIRDNSVHKTKVKVSKNDFLLRYIFSILIINVSIF